jgi:hypothetical protein
MTDKNVKIRRAKHDKENPYYMARRATSQDRALSYEALGILHYILSKPDDWNIQPTDLERVGCKRNRVYRLLNELIDRQYMERIYERDAKGRVLSVEYVAHEKPLADSPLPAIQEMDIQEVDNPEMEKRHITEDREEHKKENTQTTRKRDPFYDAIAEVWKSSASGWIVNIKSMMLGKATRGEWAKCNFTPPVVDAAEILAFKPYMEKRKQEKNITGDISACVTIQRWFYDFRNERDNPKNVISVLEGLRIVS